MAQQTDDAHASDCPAVTGDGPEWAPTKCRCEHLALRDDDERIDLSATFGVEWG